VNDLANPSCYVGQEAGQAGALLPAHPEQGHRGMIALAVARLCRMAWADSPRATGTPSSPPMHVAPADSPATVTGSGVTPKARMLPRTRARAATIARRPRAGDVAAEEI